MDNLKQFDITVNPQDHHEASLQVLAHIKPKWERELIDIKRMTEGYVNFLFKCRLKQDTEDADAVIIRVFGTMDCYNRDTEIHIMKMLTDRHVIPPLYCRFQNGIAYAYAPGDVLSQDDMKDANVLRLLAQKFHSVHQLAVGDYLSQSGKPQQHELALTVWDCVLKADYTELCSQPRYQEHLPSLEELTAALHKNNDVFLGFGKSYPFVFCHLDAHMKNIVYCRKTNQVAMLDWEACNLGPEIYDLVVVLDRELDLEFDKDADVVKRKQWLKIYLSSHPAYSGQPLTQDVLDRWYRDSIQASMVSTLYVVIFIIYGMKHSPVKQDFLSTAIRMYQRHKAYSQELDLLDGVANSNE